MQPLIIDASALFNFGHRGELQDLLKQLQRCYRLGMILLGLDLGRDCKLAIDERTARREASALGLTVTGTVGLLKDALDRGWRTDAECMMSVKLLVERGFWLRSPGTGESFQDFFRALGS